MKQGRIAVWDEIDGRFAAALIENGKVEDVIIDPIADRPVIGNFYRAKIGRAMKGQGGAIVDLGQGISGFLKDAKGLPEGSMVTVQVSHYAERAKATPVTTRLSFKSAFAILTPNAPGYNIAKSIRDDDARDQLALIAKEAMIDQPDDWGLILRSGSDQIAPDAILDDIQGLCDLADKILSDNSDKPCLLFAQNAQTLSYSAWTNPAPDQLESGEDAFERLGVWDYIAALGHIETPLPSGGSFTIEPTRALVAVDVNTGKDLSLGAGLNANLETARTLPKALRLRGLGGQITIDFAPSPKKDRRYLEDTLRKSLKADGIDTILVGWTPLGHYELQRKHERLPLSECVQLD